MIKRIAKSDIRIVSKTIMVFVIVFALCVGLCSCREKDDDQVKERYDYPSDLTSEYCAQNYFQLSHNYMYSKAYENKVRGKGQMLEDTGGLWEFYAVYGESTDNYLVAYLSFPQFYSNETVLLRANGADSEPIFDYEISEIEIYAYGGETQSFEQIMDYERSTTFFSLDKSSDDEIKNSLLQCVLNHHSDGANVEASRYDSIQRKNAVLSFSEEGEIEELPLVLRVRFRETDGIFWQAAIVDYKGEWYLWCQSCKYKSELIELDDVLKQYIDKIFAEHLDIHTCDTSFSLP